MVIIYFMGKERLILDLQSKVQRLEDEKKMLLAEIKSLRLRLKSHEVRKTSHNSSNPPSHDFAKNIRKKSLRNKSGLPSGGQPGHLGRTLERKENPDKVESQCPSHCERCGKSLQGQKPLCATSYQVVDIPKEAAFWTEYRSVKVRCGCGCVNSKSLGHKGVIYGPRVKALISYLSIRQYLSHARISEFLNETYSLRISEGTIANILNEQGKLVAPWYEYIRKVVTQSNVVGSDETGFRVNGKLHWVWTWQSPEATYLSISKSRGKAAVEENYCFGFPNSTLVHDRWAAQINTPGKEHQLCVAHLIRELRYLKEVSPENNWINPLKTLFEETISLEKSIGDDYFARLQMMNEAKARFTSLMQAPAYGKKAENLKRSLIKHQDKLWHYIEQKAVPATNNSSEQALRNVKIKQKISTSMRTLCGAEIFCKLRSIAETCRKQGKSFFKALLQISEPSYSTG